MQILLAAATSFEIQATINGSGTQVLITGVGAVPTTWALMRHIDSKRPDVIIQAGIAGCFAGHHPGEVFAIAEDEFADLGVWEKGKFLSPFDLGLADRHTPPFRDGRLVNPYHRLLSLTRLPAVKALTVNEITTEPLRIAWYQQNREAVVETMEGGPLHYVCLMENIPFLQLRAVSNAVGVRDKSKWDIPLAVTRLNEQLIRILDQLASADPSIFQTSNH